MVLLACFVSTCVYQTTAVEAFQEYCTTDIAKIMLDVNIAKKDIDDRVDAAKKLVRYMHMHSLCQEV